MLMASFSFRHGGNSTVSYTLFLSEFCSNSRAHMAYILIMPNLCVSKKINWDIRLLSVMVLACFQP